jgi:hypothetical protein
MVKNLPKTPMGVIALKWPNQEVHTERGNVEKQRLGVFQQTAGVHQPPVHRATLR